MAGVFSLSLGRARPPALAKAAWVAATAPIFGACLALVGAAGCGQAPRLRVDPSGYHVHGYYVGSRANVKVFVEGLAFVEGGHDAVVAEIAILNERPSTVRFLAGENALAVDGTRVSPAEGQAILIPPGEIARVTLTFRGSIDDRSRGTLEISGVEVEAGQRLHFDVPVYAAEDDEPAAAAPPPEAARGNPRGV